MALLVRLSIDAGAPGAISRWIFGYALGAYIAIPNYGLVLEATIPDAHVPRHRIISRVPLLAYLAGTVALAHFVPFALQMPSMVARAPVAERPNQQLPRSVENFLFGLDALYRANVRPNGIAPDSNIRRVAAIFREAIDSAAFVDRAELNHVYPGLGDHFLDDAVRHMGLIANIVTTHSDAAADQAMASIVAWQRWWNASRAAVMDTITSRYSKQ